MPHLEYFAKPLAGWLLNYPDLLRILTAASLDFLGVGLASDQPAWGRLIRSGQAYLADAPWIAVSAALALCLTSVGLILAGESRPDGKTALS